MKGKFATLFLVLIVGTVFRASALAWAGPIGPDGFDLFATAPVTFVTFDPDGPGPLEPVSAQLRGLPIGPENSDTIVQRKNPLDIPPDGTIPPNAPIPIELVALSLQSVNPVVIAGTNFNLRVLGGDLLIPRSSPDGSITNLMHVDPAGGTFDSTLPIDVDLIFTQVGNPANIITQRFTDTLVSTGTPWVTHAAAGRSTQCAVSGGKFLSVCHRYNAAGVHRDRPFGQRDPYLYSIFGSRTGDILCPFFKVSVKLGVTQSDPKVFTNGR
jgi:hypothetical protein